MVKDGGDALFDGVHIQRRSGGAGAVHHQVAVDGPPCAVQHLIEVGGVVAHDAQATGQRGVDVGVGVDECGHDDAALGVDDVGVGVFGAQGGLLAYLYDLRARVGHSTVFVVAFALAVAGDEPSVDDQCHRYFLLFLAFFHGAVNKKCFKSSGFETLKRAPSDSCSPCAKHFLTATNLGLSLLFYLKNVSYARPNCCLCMKNP